MIDNIVMIIIICADPVTAFSGTNLGFPILCTGSRFVTHFTVEKTGTKDFKGFCLVFKLTSFILTGNDSARGIVRDTDSTVGCVDSLTAMA